jgi:hypothetical protein
LPKKDVETEFEVDEEEDETLWWSSVCKGGMSVSGMNFKYSDVLVMATERDGKRNQSWTDAQRPYYVCEMVIATAGIYQAMIPDVSS